MTTGCIWHGSSTEWNELTEAITHNCTCGERTRAVPRCAAHQLVAEQRAVDRLLFARRIASRLLQEEMAEGSAAIVGATRFTLDA
jgi:hypothetical protein